MVVQQRSQIGFNAPCQLKQRVPIRQAKDKSTEPETDQHSYELRESTAIGGTSGIDRGTTNGGHRNLKHQGEDPGDSTSYQGAFVLNDDGNQPTHPAKLSIWIDAARWRTMPLGNVNRLKW